MEARPTGGRLGSTNASIVQLPCAAVALSGNACPNPASGAGGSMVRLASTPSGRRSTRVKPVPSTADRPAVRNRAVTLIVSPGR